MSADAPCARARGSSDRTHGVALPTVENCGSPVDGATRDIHAAADETGEEEEPYPVEGLWFLVHPAEIQGALDRGEIGGHHEVEPVGAALCRRGVDRTGRDPLRAAAAEQDDRGPESEDFPHAPLYQRAADLFVLLALPLAAARATLHSPP